MKRGKKIVGLTLPKQVDLLKKRVYLTHPDFYHLSGQIVSIRVTSKHYWILLDNVYVNRHDKKTRLRMFDEKYIRVVEERKILLE
jgi:hypothetical protein